MDTWLNLSFRVGSFHGGGDHGNEPALGSDLVGVADHRHVDVGVAANLEIREKIVSSLPQHPRTSPRQVIKLATCEKISLMVRYCKCNQHYFYT